MLHKLTDLEALLKICLFVVISRVFILLHYLEFYFKYLYLFFENFIQCFTITTISLLETPLTCPLFQVLILHSPTASS